MSGPRNVTMFDCAWLASDQFGQLAAFITAGEGPIPSPVFDGPVDILEIEERLSALPVIGSAQLLVSVPDPSSFAELSERGLFVYDWTDIHAVERERIHAYEIVAKPSQAALVADLPDDLRATAMRVSLDIDFRVAPRVALQATAP